MKIMQASAGPGNEDNRMKKCKVKLYSLSTCGHCQDTKDLLDRCGADYECVEVDQLAPDQRQKLLAEIKKLNPECGFPTTVIDEKVIVGFKKDKIKEALGI
jgi:glutaredoxin-like protein NrdH